MQHYPVNYDGRAQLPRRHDLSRYSYESRSPSFLQNSLTMLKSTDQPTCVTTAPPRPSIFLGDEWGPADDAGSSRSVNINNALVNAGLCGRPIFNNRPGQLCDAPHETLKTVHSDDRRANDNLLPHRQQLLRQRKRICFTGK